MRRTAVHKRKVTETRADMYSSADRSLLRDLLRRYRYSWAALPELEKRAQALMNRLDRIIAVPGEPSSSELHELVAAFGDFDAWIPIVNESNPPMLSEYYLIRQQVLSHEQLGSS